MSETRLVYVGTYTQKLGHVDGHAEGILIFRLDLRTGGLTRIGCRPGVANPSYLALEPRRRRLFAVSEVKHHAGGMGGSIHAYAIGADGALRALNQRATGGLDPCYVDLDATGEVVMAANYSSGSVIAFRVEADGALGPETAFIQHELPGAQLAEARGAGAGSSRTAAVRGRNPLRQEGPHAHSCVVDAANARMYACDLGCDRIFAYRLDARSGALAADPAAHATAPLGSGPRHLVFHPDRRHAYAMLELSSQVGAFTCDRASGKLEAIQTIPLLPQDYASTVPPAARGVSSDIGADIHLHPSGRFLYASHRGHDSISAFAVDARTGTLSLIAREPTQGRTPRGFAIDPSGAYLLAANQDSDSIVTFHIDQRSGWLSPSGKTARAESPVCLKLIDEAR
jgi:6-phosphogluconolactonase